MKKKDSNVETLRGIAIILVVIGHVIGNTSTGGMKVNDDSIFRYLYYTFAYLRLPLFTVISGWVYALSPAFSSKLIEFNLKKMRRLLLPLVFVGGSYFILRYITPNTNAKEPISEIWKILIFPFSLYWYLPSLFLIFLAISIIDAFKKLNKIGIYIIVLIIAFILHHYVDTLFPYEFPNFFSYKGAIYLLPFFLLGVGIKRFDTLFKNKILVTVSSIVLIVCLFIQQCSWFNIFGIELSKDNIIGLLIGTSGNILLFNLRLNIKWLIWFGNYAYGIYLFHAFGTAGGRIIIKLLGVKFPIVVFIVSLIIGLSLPIVVETVINPFKYIRMLLLGKSIQKKKNINKR